MKRLCHDTIHSALTPVNLITSDLNNVDLFVNPMDYLGKTRSSIVQDLLRLNLPYEAFLYWLAVPSLGLLFSFKVQICINITAYPNP